MIAEVEGLAADERGLVLGLLRSGAVFGASLAGPGADRCRAALVAVEALPPDARAAEGRALADEVAAPLPEGLALVHPGWVRRLLERESSDVIRAVTRGGPEEVRRVADEILGARQDVEGPSLDGPGVAELRRATFAALAPMPMSMSTPDGGPRLARDLCALPFGALLAELDRRGATALGLALAGAPDATLARAAAAAGEPLARVVLAAARGPASPEVRLEARALIAAVRASDEGGVVRAAGLHATARALVPEGHAALVAVAQRLPVAVGDALLACAGVDVNQDGWEAR